MRPKREHATANGQTYMVTFETSQRRALFRNTKWAELFIEVLHHYRGKAYLLHEFAVMPDHVHILMTPNVSLERAVQFIKGGFSFRVKKELGSNLEVWQKGFSDHRIRDSADFAEHILYIHNNPTKEGLCERGEDYLYSSAHTRLKLDPAPLALGGSRAGMKQLITIFVLAMFLTACSRNSHNADLAGQGITVCGTVADDNHQPVANAFIELHHSAKDPTVMQTRYQVGRTDNKGQFEVQGVAQGQYWLAVVPKGPCDPKSKDENEARRVEVDVPNGTPGPECKTQWQVVQDASCKVTVQ